MELIVPICFFFFPKSRQGEFIVKQNVYLQRVMEFAVRT